MFVHVFGFEIFAPTATDILRNLFMLFAMSHNLLGDIVTRQWSCIVIVAHLLYFCTLINIGECLIDAAPDPGPLPTGQDLLVFDATRTITCLGAHTDIGWNLELSGTRNLVRPVDDGRSMQELCAHPTYGGKASFPNFGGYCHAGDVFFSELGEEVELMRSYLECRNRCFCNNGLQDPNQQPKSVAETRKTFDHSTGGSRFVMALDRRARSRLGWPHLLTKLYGTGTPLFLFRNMDVGITPGNKIQCHGPLPGFPLPDGFDQHDFANNQALCATQLAGGNPAANAGAYCHRTIPSSRNERVVSFADDQTPRLSWTWDGGNGAAFLYSAAVRLHCWKNCICQDRTKLKNYLDPQVRMWEALVQAFPQLYYGKGNKYPMGSSTDSKGKPRTSSRGANNPSKQCAATPDKPATCTPPWPSEILGPLPKALKALGSVNPPPVEEWDQGKTCGNACSDYNDCGGDCLCRLPSSLESRTHGWDPVGHVTRCMDVASVLG